MRIELTTLGLLDPRSNQLSYEDMLRAAQYNIIKPLNILQLTENHLQWLIDDGLWVQRMT